MQKIIKGISNLPSVLKEFQCQKLFIVVDASYQFLSIRDVIEELDVAKVEFSEFTPNPIFEQVSNGIDIFRKEQCDAILAIGGGSAIDVSKCIKLSVLAKEGKSGLIPPLVSKRLDMDGSKLPFIAIPTTAGTGSESTHNAVMYHDGAKQTITNDGILPDYAILEPTVLKTLPLYQKKCTMMDALCQAIESWWSVNSTDESKEYSKKAIELIMPNWEAYIFNYSDEAAENIMLAANYAGRAISIAQTTAAHAMSYKITSLYGFPHGHAVAVCLPEIWEYMMANVDKCTDARGERYLADIFDQISRKMGTNSPNEAIALFRTMIAKMEMKNPVAEDYDEELIALSTSVNPIRLKNNPIELEEKEIKELYKRIIY